MSDGLKDILSNLNKDIEQDKLLQYLNNHLADAEQHAFEQIMNEDDFISDAVEGLQSIENKNQIPNHIRQLNIGLKKQLKKQKNRKHNRKIGEQSWIIYSMLILLILVIIAFVVIRMLP